MLGVANEIILYVAYGSRKYNLKIWLNYMHAPTFLDMVTTAGVCVQKVEVMSGGELSLHPAQSSKDSTYFYTLETFQLILSSTAIHPHSFTSSLQPKKITTEKLYKCALRRNSGEYMKQYN